MKKNRKVKLKVIKGFNPYSNWTMFLMKKNMLLKNMVIMFQSLF